MQKLPTPCHIIDVDRLKENLERIRLLKEAAGCKILLAVKGFSAPYFFEPMQGVLDGVSASGPYEARLGRESFGGYVQTYSPAFREEDIADIAKYSDTVIFNSTKQLELFSFQVRQVGCMCGVRINPMKSSIWKEDADPCRAYSRLGIPVDEVTPEILTQVDGIHFHAMCEQYTEALEELGELLVSRLGDMIRSQKNIKWVNLGGGQLIGRQDYDIGAAARILTALHDKLGVDIILEPCEGIVTECGSFATKVCDIVSNGRATAIMDASPCCHMPDAVFRGWRHDVRGELPDGQEGYGYYLSGPTCFAGDTFGYYVFGKPLNIGDIIIFEDTAAYTWVKNNTFNGIPAPMICEYSKEKGLVIKKTYSYDTFFEKL